MKYEDIADTEQFKSMHPTAKRLLKKELKALFEKGVIEDADIININLLVEYMDEFYRLKDRIGDNYTTINTKGLEIENPMIKTKNVLGKQILGILSDFGGSCKSRRQLNKKEMIEAEDSPFDELNRDELDDF